MTPEKRPLIGIVNGIILGAAIWAVVLWLAFGR